ncbi:hypothetical protein GA0070607_3888 [Micromonospora coriariae]|uniref:3-keto-disaccharide hydrolase domain-containing protein n=1 Tax=Micromonospora coriariae TaxID=285665 RepID=A0A1C4WMX6_9ACTN|nr:hypothetical protein [Micromonospora coriariae]SCE97626.1 hypothetical protein GA0070607_3888 [Micromonospora coriariae]
MTDGIALTLLVLGVALGVVGNWIKRPQKLSGRWVVGIFTLLLVAASIFTFLEGRLPDGLSSPPRADTATVPAQVPTMAPPASASATPTPTASARPSTSPKATPESTTKSSAGPQKTGAKKEPPRSPYVAASNFQRFGGTHGPFTMVAEGTALRIDTPDSIDSQWGAYLKDHMVCDGTVEFDVRLGAGTVDYYGLAVLPRGGLDNDQATGDAIILYRDSDGSFIAKFSSLPTPGVGGVGGGSYPVADLRQTRHVVVSARGSTYFVKVDGIPAGQFAETESAGCGKLTLAAWGGTTAHIDDVLVR